MRITSSVLKSIKDRLVGRLGLLSFIEQPSCSSPKDFELFDRLEAEIDLFLRKTNAKYYKKGLDEFFWD